MKYDFTHFTDELSKIKCTLNNSQLEQFELYYDMLIEKNKVMNLRNTSLIACFYATH